MCLITFAYQQHPEYSLIMVANRDEFYARPTLDMHFWKDHPNVLAGKDLQQNGTWLGINKNGKLAAVTNFRDGTSIESNVKSRGALTRRFLTKETPAKTYLQELATDSSPYGGFNLLLGDTTGLYYCSNKGAPSERIAPGVYGLSNAYLDSSWPKVDAAKQGLVELIKRELSIESLANLLHSKHQAADKDLPNTGISYEWEKQLSACFINIPSYGTRATTVLLQKNSGETQIAEFRFNPSGKVSEERFTLLMKPIG
ncbi:NRDE family protein [Neptunomonas japonica]|uniref:NRDE family protein n=1 Tax=Neptunomonas japonica TaxID=417574 RepID=UPI00041646EF|nr:NRDE family protein [Neptunomonas japonica]